MQACADDPQIAVHAIRNLSRAAFGTATIRWTQLGYGRTSSTSTAQLTPRNLFGFKDGTANVKAEETDALEEHVWVPDADLTPTSAWLAGGSFLVARRIRMRIETWDRTSLREQEGLIGRTKGVGAPLSGGTEFTEPDFAQVGGDGKPLIAVDSHVRLAHPSENQGVRMLRRGYNFTDGNDSLGRLDAGLFFLAFVKDPRTHYIPMQSALSSHDGLMEYLTHTASGLFAVPPGVPDGLARPGRGRHAGDHRRQPVRRPGAVRLTAAGTLPRVTTDAPVRTPLDAGTPTRVWLVAILTVLALEMVRASGPLLDRAFAVSTVDAALVSLGTYAGAGVVVAVVLLVARCSSGTPDSRALVVGSAAARRAARPRRRPSTGWRWTSSAS